MAYADTLDALGAAVGPDSGLPQAAPQAEASSSDTPTATRGTDASANPTRSTTSSSSRPSG